MRAGLIGALIVFAASSAAFGQTPPPPPKPDQVYDIPPGSKDQSVIILKRDFKPGENATPHIHHGVEMAEVLSGTFEVYRAGQKMEVVQAGGSFLIPRETPHDAKNISSEVGRLSITFVIDKGTPLRTPVDASLIK